MSKDHSQAFRKPAFKLDRLDPFVGSDKIYADPQEWDIRFYTSLKFWRRDDSNMWYFGRFLRYWGWRL